MTRPPKKAASSPQGRATYRKRATLGTTKHGVKIYDQTPSRPFRVVWRDPATGSQVERTAHSVDEAWEIAHQSEAALAAYTPAPEEHTPPAQVATTHPVNPADWTIRDLADRTISQFTKRNLAESYISKIKGVLHSQILPRIGDVLVADWLPHHTSDVLDAAANVVGHERLKDIRQAFRCLAATGESYRIIKHGVDGPLHGMTHLKNKPTKVDRENLPLLDECLRIEAAAAKVLGPDWAIALKLTREGMLRWGELIALTPSSIVIVGDGEAQRREIHITSALAQRRDRKVPGDPGALLEKFYVKTPKSGNARVSSFAASLVPELLELLERVPEGHRLFVTKTGRTPDRSWWAKMWKKVLQEAGFEHRATQHGEKRKKGWTIHDWRHVGACIWLFERHVDAPTVSQALGHANVSFTLDRYTRPRGEVANTLSAASSTC